MTQQSHSVSRQNYNSERYMCSYIHSSTVHKAKTGKQPTYPVADEWMKMCGSCIQWNTARVLSHV